jgi:hypothetical protein
VGRACPFKIASDFSHVYRVLDDGALSLGWLQKEAEEEGRKGAGGRGAKVAAVFEALNFFWKKLEPPRNYKETVLNSSLKAVVLCNFHML